MSLLDKIASLNINDPAEYVPNQRLTKDEKLGLTEMFQSNSWDVLTTRLWPQILKINALKALTAKEDQRFYQGMFLGYKQLVDSARQFQSGGIPEKVMEKLAENNLDDPTGYDSDILY